jgi:error-prone DNA polymerase
MNYTELGAYSNFSFLRGASHAEELVEQAHELGYSALGICDINTLSGIVRANVAAKKFGLKLIIGSTITPYIKIPDRNSEPDLETIPPELLPFKWDSLLEPFIISAYPISERGYRNLSTFLTIGKSRAPKGCCFLTVQDFDDRLKENHLVIQVLDPEHPSVPNSLNLLTKCFSKDLLSLSISDNYGPDNRLQMEQIIELGKEFKIKLVVRNNVLFHIPERKPLQDVLTCIRQTLKLEDGGFSQLQNAERYLKPPQEMDRLFRWLPEALERTDFIKEQAKNFSLDQLRYEYPHEICPENKAPIDYLRELTYQGLKERYPQGAPEKVILQIRHEFDLIRELGYAKYFLTVHDLVVYARSKNILCQGRGAAANSAICYCLGITSVDPNNINLLFERFISKERNEPPDIDIDFEHERREEVIQYIYNKYGRNRAALVCEVVSYRTKSAFKDIGKVLSLSEDEIGLLVKAVKNADEETPLELLLEKAGLDPNSWRIQATITLAQQLMGFPRHLSQHVGGFIISECPLSELVPIENASMENRSVIEWDKDDIEAVGMLKIDCLALGMLTCIRKTFDLIAEAYKTPKLILATVPQDDSDVYDMICEADTLGVFQIESRAQMSMLPRLRPRCYYDLVIEVAIVRPGPIQGGMVHPYLKRRMGKEKVHFPSEEIKRVLGPTLGVPIFQEQAMELTIVAAGFTPGRADELRRAMASWKKNKNALQKFKEDIITGMKQNGYTEEYAKQCFNQIQGFGEYGFPQSHSASFALLVYVSCWLKYHHPAAFCAALINSQPMGFYQPSQILQDAARHGVEILPIDINFSDWDCTLEEVGTNKIGVRVGLRMTRGLNKDQVNKIVAARKKISPSTFKSIQTIYLLTKVHPSTLRSIARVDGFKSLGLNRKEALWEIQRLKQFSLPILELIQAKRDSVELPQTSLEEDTLDDYSSSAFSLKAHPISFLRPDLIRHNVVTTYTLKERSPDRSHVSVAGIVLMRQQPPTAAGFIFLTLEDETGSANLIIKPDVYRKYRDAIYDSIYLLVSGEVQKQQGIIHLVVEDAINLRPIDTDLIGTDSISTDSIDLVRNFY